MVAAASLIVVAAGLMLDPQSLLGQCRNRSPLTAPRSRPRSNATPATSLRARTQSPLPQPPQSRMRRYRSVIHEYPYLMLQRATLTPAAAWLRARAGSCLVDSLLDRG